MSRRDTLQTDRWRVQVRQDGLVSHESMFADRALANAYYESIHIPGSTKSLQLRAADEARYVVLIASGLMS